MSDNYSESSSTSWGKRIMNSFAGIIIGLLVFLASFGVIWWNEGRSVDRIKTLEEGRGIVVSANADQVNTIHQNALIHLSGIATTPDTVSDSQFGVQVQAIKLKRIVEMYQWRQKSTTKTEKKLGGGETQTTTYSYSKIWSEGLINSTEFKKSTGHTNPATMPYSSQRFQAENVTLGAYKLSEAFVSQINNYQDYTLTIDNLNAMDANLKKAFKLIGNQYFFGNAASPEIGAVRVKYTVAMPTEASVIGKQNNGIVETYTTQNGTLQLLQTNIATADAMFDSSESANSLMTWAIRFGAFLLMWGGLSRILAPIRVLGDVVPLVGRILGAGIGLVTGIIAAILTIITIALAWIFFRPLIGFALLAIAALFFFGGFKAIRTKLAKITNQNAQDQDASQA